MEKRVRPKEELLEMKEQIVEKYNEKHMKYNRPGLLTKSEKKVLGIGKDEGKAILKHQRISARKVKIVLDLIRGKGIEEAYAILKFTPKAASLILTKLLKSAEANAINNNGLEKDSLVINEIYAGQGKTLKRFRPRAQGRASRIRKRTSHITLVLKEKITS